MNIVLDEKSAVAAAYGEVMEGFARALMTPGLPDVEREALRRCYRRAASAAGRPVLCTLPTVEENRGPQFEPPDEWDGEARVLLIALLWIARQGSA